jgi:predicted DNA binding protein
MILRRYALSGKALEQLQNFAKRNHLLNKVINLNSKWGFDFSLDYVNETEAFEILHYEYDGFDYDTIIQAQQRIRNVIDNSDFESIAQDLIKRKSEWFNLDFFEQSHWKCNYFNIPDERFKLVIWNKAV